MIKSSQKTPRCASHHGVRLRGVHPSLESNLSNFVIEYLGKIETEFENTLKACLSGAQMGSNHEIIEVENLGTHSLIEVHLYLIFGQVS